MTFTYSMALTDLSDRAHRRGINYSLDRFKDILSRLGNPHTQLSPVVHIAGTNGKGSTLAYIRSVLTAHGLSVGSFTSPHITDYCERITIDNAPISPSDFANLYHSLSNRSELDSCTEFEILTIMMLWHFRDRRPDVILVETGLGGRLDCTNVVSPILSVITPINLDHQAILGPDIRSIAREKAGIIKPHTPILSAIQLPESAKVLDETAQSLASPITYVHACKSIPPDFRMQGDYQRQNSELGRAAAIHVLNTLGKHVDLSVTDLAISHTSLPGRFDICQRDGRRIYIDGAHNAHAAQALRDSLDRHNVSNCTLFLGLSKGRNAMDILAPLETIIDRIYYSEFDETLGTPYPNIIDGLSSNLANRIELWTNSALPPGSPLVITGSLYFISRFYTPSQQ